MDLKVICALSVILVVALSTLAEGKAPPSKYCCLQRYVCGPDPTDCNCSKSMPPVYVSDNKCLALVLLPKLESTF